MGSPSRPAPGRLCLNPVRATPQVGKVLAVFMADPSKEWFGREIMQLTGLNSGTLYPILERLELAGWLVSQWKPNPGRGVPRRFYELTVGAEEAAAGLVAEAALL